MNLEESKQNNDEKYVSKEDIEHYYEVAPIIVEAINKEEKANIVDYCVEQIEQGNYEAA